MLAKSPTDRPDAEDVVAWCWQTYLSAPTDPTPAAHPTPDLPLADTVAIR
jgi:eukaryotic-like serine/threonine-protein kinase